MNCERVERLLPAFIDGELSSDESAMVQEHISVCQRCAGSYAVYSTLERSLTELKQELPPPESVYTPLLVKLTAARRRSRLRAAFSLQSISAFTLLACSMVLYLYRYAINGLFVRLGDGYTAALRFISEDIPDLIIRAGGGASWALYSIFTFLILLILATAGFALMKFAEE